MEGSNTLQIQFEKKYNYEIPIWFETFTNYTRQKQGKWRVYGMFGVQNSLKRFANIPIHVVKWRYNGESKTDFPFTTSGKTVLEPFITKEEAEKWYNTNLQGVEILEMTLTEDQITKWIK